MRRRLNKNSIWLILVIALFTLLSYSFDQLVIRNEDKIRNLQIQLDNSNTKLDNLYSIENQLTSLSELSLNEYTHLKRANKYWLKAIIINTDHENSYLLKKNNIKKFSENFDLNLIQLRFSQHMLDVYIAMNTIKNKYSNIYWWNSDYFKNNEVFVITISEVFDSFKKELNNKELEFYVNVATPKKRENVIRNMSINDWHDQYKFAHALTNELTKYHGYIEMDLNRIEKYQESLEASRNDTIDLLSKISTNKNYFILSSIISQIFSLFFLLILFRVLIKN
tara:strand:- start:1000 stop:1839 length:840 start_codon:yes stop_codon:yes gene_type:complete